jgi:hypothetical protein
MADFPESLSVVHDGLQVINLTAEPITQIDIRNGRLLIKDEDGNAPVELSGVRQGRLLRLGGQGHAGRIFIEDSTGVPAISMAGQVIDIGNEQRGGNIHLRKSTSGQITIGLTADTAKLQLGGGGVDGEVVVRKGDGSTAIHLDGAAGDIVLGNADCAEEFNLTDDDDVEPGDVVVLTDGRAVRRSTTAFDKRVVGIVSGAGSTRPGIVLGHKLGANRRLPVAVTGKVFCKVDAYYGPLETGDLLTTSGTPGHAMTATDPIRAFGTTIGKALAPLDEGVGLVPVLVGLR